MDVKRQEFQAEKQALIKANSTYWDSSKPQPTADRWIYVYHCLSHEFEYSVHENIVAKGLQGREALPITVVTDGAGDVSLDNLDASFGFGKSHHLFYSKFDHIVSRIRTYVTAQYLAAKTYKKKDKLFQMKYRGIDCGDVIHDDILRKSMGKVFDCFDVNKKKYAKHIRSALSMVDKAYEMFKEKPPAYLITSECLYIKGLVASVAVKLGAKVLVVSNDYPDTLMQISPGRALFQELKMSELLQKQIETYLKQKPLSADNEKDLFVYGGRERETGNLLEQMGITNGNKNVFILMHVFSDCPRAGYHHHFYDEYNEWFLDTLRIIKEIPGVNWIIKDHPMGPRYNQCEYVRKVFLQNKTSNMYWCDRNIRGMEIKEVADCIITCVGEAALEYWAYEIPTITVSTAYFSGWGISYNMKSLEEYEAALKNISGLKKPDEQSMELAQKCLLALKQMGNSEDELARLFLEVRRIQLKNYKTGEHHLHIETFCEKYIELLKRIDIRSSMVYQLKNIYDV